MKIRAMTTALIPCACFASAASAQILIPQASSPQAASHLIATFDSSQVQRLSQNDTLPIQLLRPDQYKVFANFVKVEGAYQELGILKPGMTDRDIVSLPVYVNFILAASVEIYSGDKETYWEPAYRYSHPTSVPPQASGDAASGMAPLSAIPTSKRAARNELLFRSAKPMVLGAYPAGLPIPEAAFVRQARVPFSALSPSQQKFVKSVIMNSKDALPQPFDWGKAVVYFARTLNFRGGVVPNQPPLNTKVSGFRDQIW